MALAYIDLGIVGQPQLLVLNNGVPYGIQNAQGVLTQFGASSFSSVAGTANQITATTVGSVVTLTLPAAVVAPGSLSATTEFLLPSYLKTALPAVGTAGGMIYVSNATGAHVTGSACFSNGTSWIDVTTGIAVV
jgi:hypothetical protein